MSRYVYSKIEKRRTKTDENEYTFDITESKEYSLIDILNEISYYGWRFIGEVDSELIVAYEEEEE